MYREKIMLGRQALCFEAVTWQNQLQVSLNDDALLKAELPEPGQNPMPFRPCQINSFEKNRLEIEAAGSTKVITVLKTTEQTFVQFDGLQFTIDDFDEEKMAASAGSLYSPISGRVVSVLDDGQKVAAGERIIVLEAMKMESALTAQISGTITNRVKPGELVKQNQLLLEIEP